MSLSCGIVGLPNVGKSTLFNALLKRQQAYVANFPFATIEPNIGVVPIDDVRLKKLSQVVKESEGLDFFPPEVPATVEFVDIAGLIAGAHKGEGLGNKFLSHIREVNAICHVVRSFSDENIIKEGSVDPKIDLETIETELKLADLQTIEKVKEQESKRVKIEKDLGFVLDKLFSALSTGVCASKVEKGFSEEQKKISKQYSLLTSKPILVVLNVDETALKDANKFEINFAKEVGFHTSQVIAISAKVESELSVLSRTDQKNYLDDLGVYESGLTRLIKKAFATLGLVTFLTAGEKEVRAWTLPSGWPAVRASSVIHTDFEKKFIKADVVDFNDFVSFGGWRQSREKGKVRSEGRDYIVKDGDVIEFRIGA